jgi:hypothetical protein
MVEASDTGKFHAHELWQIQDVPNACMTHPAVLCVASLLFQVSREEKRKHKRKKETRKKRKK